MTRASRPSLNGNGTMLVVGDESAAELLHRAGLNSRVLPSYLDVLGEMSRGPVDRVIGRLAPMNGELEATIAALRQLSPAVKLVLVIDPTEEPDAMRALRLGADDYLVRPLSPQQLLDALRGPATHAAPGAAGVTRPAIGPRIVPPPIDEPSTPPTPHEIPPAPFDAVTPLPLPAPRSTDDVQLIDHLLARRGDFRQHLLERLRQRVGGAVQFTTEEPRGLAAAPIRYADQVLGYLASARHGAGELAEHAAWMGRWMVLQHHLKQLSDMALKDELTGTWNRRYFQRTLETLLERARRDRSQVTLMLFDIDDFKLYNDRYGHGAGDEILRETAKLMSSVVRKQDIVARIGGDEFAVIFWDAEPKRDPASEHPRSVRTAARRFQQAVCQHRFPKLGDEAPGRLTISGGLASFPWDGQTAEQLVDVADRMAMASKTRGKNAVTLGPGAERMCGPE